MKRRHFLKLFAAIPFAGPVIAKALSKPEPKVELSEVSLKTLGHLPERGSLILVVAPPKFGKTAFARSAALNGNYILDNVENLSDPAADCAHLVSRGITVIAIVQELKDATLLLSYGAGPEMLRHRTNPSISRMIMQADRVILITGFSLRILPPVQDKKYVDLSWRCLTLKDRHRRNGEKWEWNTTVPFGYGLYA